MKNKIIKLKCPCCEESLILEMDKDFNIVKIINDTIELSESQIENLLNKNNIEIG